MHKHSRDTRTAHSTRAQMSTHKNAGKKLTRKFVLLYVARSLAFNHFSEKREIVCCST